jgi:hypothetical protein
MRRNLTTTLRLENFQPLQPLSTAFLLLYPKRFDLRSSLLEGRGNRCLALAFREKS